MKPLQQLYGLALQDIYNLENQRASLNNYNQEIIKMKNAYQDLEEYNKKKEKYCSTKVKVLLFDKFLQKIYNEKHNIQTITQFFVKK